jgi:hypothetical protein
MCSHLRGSGEGSDQFVFIVLSLFVHLQEAVFMTRTSDHLVTASQGSSFTTALRLFGYHYN